MDDSEIVKKTNNNKIGYKNPPNPGPGRPKGSKNKFTSLKDEFLKAFFDEKGINGAEGLISLIGKSDKAKMMFLQLISKMLPTSTGLDEETRQMIYEISERFVPGEKEGDEK